RGHGGGLGLGLSLVERLCNLLGLSIDVRSRVGRGSCFSVRAPAAPAATVVGDTATDLAGEPGAIKGKAALIIEDDALARGGMSGLLTSWGCQVIAVDSDDDAIQMVTSNQLRPELIISDLHLGDGKTGVEAIESLRKALGVSVPAFLVTGDITSPQVAIARSN